MTGGDQDVNSVDLKTLGTTPSSVQERIFEAGSALRYKTAFHSERRACVSDSILFGGS